MTKLYDYQKESADHLESVFRSGPQGAIDGSDMGTGKTPVAVEVIRRMDLPTVVVCPKVSVPTWSHWGRHGGAEFACLGYEALRTGNSGFGAWETRRQWAGGKRGTAYEDVRTRFVWDASVGIVVFDEAHRCAAMDSQNALMLRAAKEQGLKILLVSATPAESPLQMRAIGYALDLHSWGDFFLWAERHGCYRGVFAPLDWTKDAARQAMFMDRIHAHVWPRHGVRVRKTDPRVKANFPEGVLAVDLVQIKAEHEMARLDKVAAAAWAGIQEARRSGKSEDHPMVQFLRTLQEQELLMVPSLVELVKESVSQGRRCPVFVNYSPTIRALSAAFPKAPVIDGAHNDDAYRSRVVEEFQADAHEVLLLNARAGSESLSLHDLNGRHPREAFIIPPTSARVFRQETGRIDRSGGKSPFVNRVLVAAGTAQERLKERIDQKSRNIDLLVDGDLNPYENGRTT